MTVTKTIVVSWVTEFRRAASSPPTRAITRRTTAATKARPPMATVRPVLKSGAAISGAATKKGVPLS
ncbi:hypothetical protein [Streptomyces sp. NPDC048057]|uniref:hypothetical protein n=1 Tax=Streptomyces sp. NPDC048057 TaxID=3155628 RepID=UPI0033D494E3